MSQNNGDGRRRRSDDMNSYEADTDRAKKQQQYNRRSPTPPGAQHPQHVPLLKSQRSQEDLQEVGYGAMTGPPMPPGYVIAPFGMQPQAPNYYPSPPAQGGIPPYGQPHMYQQRQSQSGGLPPPPPPSQPYSQSRPGRKSRGSPRNTSVSPVRPLIDSSLYYSDEDDVSPLPSPAGTPPMKEVRTKTIDGSSSKQTSRKSILKVTSFSDMTEDLTSIERAGNHHHRRNNSDFMYNSNRKKRQHRRTNSADLGRKDTGGEFQAQRSPLPLHPYHRKSAPAAPRSRSSSVTKSHRRRDSGTSVASMISILSEKSVVSDISRSALYKEKTTSGRVRFHAPTDRIRLVMDDDLAPGHLYRVRAHDEEEGYIQYTLQSEDIGGEFPLFDDPGACGCECNACVRCQHKMEQMLMSVSYEMRVPDNLYQKVLGEISDSKQPCGVFFCGHHEDVDRPSILIAVVIVAAVFAGLLLGTYFSHGS